VILLHGASVFSFIWNRFAELLEARGYRVLCFDWYGHGFSAVPKVQYTRHLFEQQLEELLDHLHLLPSPLDANSEENQQPPPIIEINDNNFNVYGEQKPKKQQYSHEVYLIGHSMGGLIATEFAAKYKQWITKVILFNAVGLPVDISMSTILPLLLNQLVRIVRRTEYLDTAAHALGKLFGHFGHRMSVQYEDICKHALMLDEEHMIEYKNEREKTKSIKDLIPLQKWLFGSALPVASSLRFAKSLHFLMGTWLLQSKMENRALVLLSIARDLPLLDANHSNTLQQLSDIPLLIIWGEEDGLLPLHMIEKFKKQVPHAYIMRLPGSDHAAFLQRPKSSFKMITHFLDEEFEEIHKHQQIQFSQGRNVVLLKN
jgi:pimeloyl-ACP methyl ester carboxylesterase